MSAASSWVSFDFLRSLYPKADEYVRDIFGKHWRVLDRIERLPETLPGLYMELTR
jgi:nitric oxide reductase NorD protein